MKQLVSVRMDILDRLLTLGDAYKDSLGGESDVFTGATDELRTILKEAGLLRLQTTPKPAVTVVETKEPAKGETTQEATPPPPPKKAEAKSSVFGFGA